MATNQVATLNQLQESIKEMPSQMITFSRGMRSLYAESAVSGAQSMESFRQLRDAVRLEAAVYANQVLPFAHTVVINIIAYFDNYIALDYEDWEECVDEIVDELASYEKSCEILIQMHDSLIVKLKQREDEAVTSIQEMERMSNQLEEKVTEDQLYFSYGQHFIQSVFTQSVFYTVGFHKLFLWPIFIRSLFYGHC
jgi:hypothetical protein